MASFGGRTVLVTGASSGIGRATALLLAREGANVVLVARSHSTLALVQAECEDLGAKALVAVADVTERSSVEDAFRTAERTFGSVDGVVHSAAVMAYGRFEDVPAEVFDQTIRTTLGGTATVARCALTTFRRSGGGNLVVIGSVLGKISAPYMSTYVTAKWGVHALVRTLQIEARSSPGIGISLVSPGAVDTPIYRQAGTYLRRHGRPPLPVDSPERVARIAVRALDHPRREASVGSTNPLRVAGFRLLPGIFDRLVTPLMRFDGLSRGHTPDSPGNVFAPQPALEAVHGGYGGWRRHRQPQHQNQREGLNDMGSNEAGVVTVTREVDAPTQAVWDTLADGWLYATWVVGASRVRGVDENWPAGGSRIHHSFGIWPAVINDTTHVLRVLEGSELALRARGWPAGEAEVVITVESLTDDTCRVSIAEDAVTGPGTLVPRPLRQLAIGPRNVEALRRLAYLAEGRHRDRVSGR